MKRRDFALGLGAGGLGGVLALPARAQGGPTEGREYTRLARPLTGGPAGKVEVVEFFGYWCPHCAAFEPTLEAWVRALPADVQFRRIPVVFQGWHEAYQRLYFALEVMGLTGTVHAKVFPAVHAQKLRLERDADLKKLAADNGIDPAKLAETMKSFSVATRCNQANQAAAAWRIDGVPTLGVGGRFLTSVSQSGGHPQTLAVLDALIRKART